MNATKRYEFTTEFLQGTDVSSGGAFICVDAIQCEGDTLEELLDDATVFTQGQSGGEGPHLAIDCLSKRCQQLLEEHIKLLMRAQDGSTYA